jgi:hypothetical protein
MIPPFGGHCLCGVVQFHCTAAPRWQVHCHCESCRRATSSPMTSFFAIADGSWEWTGAAPQLYRSSAQAERYFCGTCGSQMAYRHATLPDEMHFYAASLDDPRIFSPTAHDFWAEHLPWLHLGDHLPR